MREDERAKKLQPFLQYLNQTPAAELLNDYTYQLIYIGRDSEEQLERLQYLQDKVTEPGSGVNWRRFDVWRAGCAKRAADDPAAFDESADRWHDRHFGKPSAPVCLLDVKPQEIQWLVPDLIPLGEISLLGADGGTGKGFWAAQLIACVTTGKTSGFFPVPPAQTGRVLVLSGEDDPGKVLTTRYMAAGADMSKVHVMTADQYFIENDKILCVNDKALADFVDTIEPILVLVDPLQSFLPGNVDMGSRNQIRRTLTPVQAINIKHNCATLIVMHTNKKQGVSGRGRLADSSDIWDIARSVLIMGYSKNDGKIYVSHEKSNYSEKQQTVLMHIKNATVEGIKTARAVFDGYTDKKDADFGRRPATLGKIEQGPFYAMPLVAGGPNTKGGLLADADRRVLAWDGTPIPRLYSVGEIASALKFVYQGGGNLTECLVYGRHVGKNVAGLPDTTL